MSHLQHTNRLARIVTLAGIFVLIATLGVTANWDQRLADIPDSTVMTIPTYEGSGHAVHPDVVYFRDGLNGSYFYMAMTPIYTTDREENPSIIVGNNGWSWTEPRQNPLVPVPYCDHNDDADLFWNDSTRQFYLNYLQTRRYCGDSQNVQLLTSDSTVQVWDSTRAIHYAMAYPTCDQFILSPALVKRHDTYYMFYVNMLSGCSPAQDSVRYLTSTDGRTWNKSVTYGISSTNWPSGLVPWHVDVFDGRDGWFYMLLTDRTTQYNLWIGRSADLQSWNFAQTPVLQGGRTYHLSGQDYYVSYPYRSTGVVNSSMDLLMLWWPFHDGDWHMATLKRTLSSLFPLTARRVPLQYATIQAAINASGAGDTVWVAPGEYREALAFGSTPVVVKSTDGPLATRVVNSPTTDLAVFTNSTAATVLEGFTLDSGRIAIWCKNAGPTIRGNLIKNQQITNWAAVVFSGLNWGTAGPSPVTFVNNTVANSRNGAISSFSTVRPMIRNCILYGANYGIHNQGGYTVPPRLAYNDVYNCSAHYYNCPDTGVGTISANPQFVIPDFTLGVTSPCADTGDPSAYYLDPDGSRNDMGAIPRGTLVVYVPANYTTIQAAINAVRNGDEIRVAAGTYTENINFGGKTIKVIGPGNSGSDTAFLQPAVANSPTVWLMQGEGAATTLSGFTIRNGGDTSTIMIGGGASPLITKNIFYNNIKCAGCGYNKPIVRCLGTGSPIFRENLFYGNGGISCIGIWTGGYAQIINNTFDGNNRGFFTISARGGTAKNNIVTNSTQYGVSGGPWTVLDYNDVWNNSPNYSNGAVPGSHSLSANPLYVNATAHNYHLQIHSPCRGTGESGVDMGVYPGIGFLEEIDKTAEVLPGTFELSQNYPNPFNPTTTIQFTLPQAGPVELSVFNINGQRVRTLIDEGQAAGSHQVVWDGRTDDGNAAASGVYFYRIVSGDYTQSRKMILLK